MELEIKTNNIEGLLRRQSFLIAKLSLKPLNSTD